MNFLHAVDHLNRGDCKAINRKFWGSNTKVQFFAEWQE